MSEKLNIENSNEIGSRQHEFVKSKITKAD